MSKITMKPVKIRDASSQFKNYLKENKRSHATILAYGKDVEQLVSFLETLAKNSPYGVDKEDIEAFLAKLSKEGYTPKSISRKLNSARTFYRFLKIKEYVTDDPTLLVLHPKYKLAPPRILTPTEYRALRDAAQKDKRMFAIIEILLQTGIRIGELAALKLTDIKKGELHIDVYEKHGERTVPFNKRASEALRSYLGTRPKVNEERIFVTKSGKPFLIRNIRTSIERYFRLAEIKGARVNDLRHTFAAYHLKHGASLTLVSKILGHKRISTTERYLQYVPQRDKETAILSEL